MPSKRKKIAILGGDGIGPEVIREAKLLLELYRDKAEIPLDLWELDLGADRYLRDGTMFPKEVGGGGGEGPLPGRCGGGEGGAPVVGGGPPPGAPKVPCATGRCFRRRSRSR